MQTHAFVTRGRTLRCYGDGADERRYHGHPQFGLVSTSLTCTQTTSRLSMPLPKLPCELGVHVIEHLGSEEHDSIRRAHNLRAIAVFARICPAWLYPGRRQLYRTVYIQDCDALLSLGRTLTATPSLRRFVEVLNVMEEPSGISLRSPVSFIRVVASIGSTLPNLKSLVISVAADTGHLSLNHPTRISLRTVYASVRSLHLNVVSGTCADHLLRTFSSLRHLRLESVQGEVKVTKPIRPLALTRLEVSSLRNTMFPSRVTNILDQVFDTSPTFLNLILRSCQETLEHVTLIGSEFDYGMP